MSYFTIDEFIRSKRAQEFKIDNTPSEEVKSHLRELIDFLNPVREEWGSPLIITSGYRCPRLNRIVNGQPTSNHLTGYAADIKPKNGDTLGFYKFLEEYLLKNRLNFDELINEYPIKGVPSWVHFALKRADGSQRCRKSVMK